MPHVPPFPKPSPELSAAEKTAAPMLELRGVSKTFRSRGAAGVRAVSDFTLTVGRGEVVGLVGESGSGKSTVARLVSRLYAPSGGEIRLGGERVPARLGGARLRRFRRRVQMIFQDPFASLNPLHPVGYTVGRLLELHGLARGKAVAGRVAELLERVGLAPGRDYARKLPHELSGGQRQRVGIARALALSPELILADEPTSMLDVSIRLDIMNLLLDLRDTEGLSLVFITHDLAGARYMSDRVAVMYAGHLVEVGPAHDVIDRPAHPYTRLLRSAAPQPERSLDPGRFEARGEVPDLARLPPGCPFEPRCAFARAECREGLPGMYAVGGAGSGHTARCILHDPNFSPAPTFLPPHPGATS